MTRSKSLVHRAYADNPTFWENAWKTKVIEQLAAAARGFVRSMLPLEFDAQIASLADPAVRARRISSAPAATKIVEELSSAGGGFRPEVAALFQTGGVGMPSGGQLRTILSPLVQQSLGSIRSSEIVAAVLPSEVYAELARILSEELRQMAVALGDSDERLVLNYTILIYHLHRWQMPFQSVRDAVAVFSSGPLGIRGWLISIQNRHLPQNVGDLFFPPVTAFAKAIIPASIQAQSDVLRVVQSESEAVSSGNGFFHRALLPERPVAPENSALSPLATQGLVEAGRRLHYPQYEHTALLFMALAGIEFLLRSHCPNATAPDQTLEEVIDLVDGIADTAKDALKNIFSSDRWNIRHRCMHGSFLELEGRREDLIRSSGIVEHHGVPRVDLSGDGSLPESVCALTLNALTDLAGQLEQSAVICDRRWTSHFLLTHAELQYANTIHCDLLQDTETAEGWRQQIRDYVRQVAPCLSIPLQMGLRSWFMNGTPIDDTLPCTHFLALLFEPLLRLTLHLGGHSVLQKSLSNSGGTHYRVQYRMLDDVGLLTQANVDLLIAHLDPADKPQAEKTLQLAVKCRDAFAHGAVWEYTDQLRVVYGHTILKAVQLVVEAGYRVLDATRDQQTVN